MDAPDLITQLSVLGFRLSCKGDMILVAPKARITDEIRRLIREHKPELLAALESERKRELAMLAKWHGTMH